MKRPIHTQKPGFGADNGGWRQPLSDLWTQLLAELHALRARSKAELEGPIGVPAAYQGVRVFLPQTNAVSVPDFAGGAPLSLRPLLVDGITYDIPVYFPGPGVFVARSVEVNIYQRGLAPVQSNTATEEMFLLARQFSTAMASTAAQDGRLRQFRYSLMAGDNFTVTTNWPLGTLNEPVPAVQFWWNLLDSKSQRYLADNLLPQQALMPMTNPPLTAPTDAESMVGYPLDGGRFYFDAPWLVERDGQMRFQFRPTTSIYTTPTAKSSSVIVQVELYGERYETLQDALRSGAMSRPVRGEEE